MRIIKRIIDNPHYANSELDLRIEALEERIEDVREVLAYQIHYPPEKDPFIKAYAVAMLATMDHPGPIHDFLYETMQAHPNMGSSYLVNKVRNAIQDHVYNPQGRLGVETEPPRARLQTWRQFPHDYGDPTAWVEALQGILADDDIATEFLIDVWARPIASNVPERGRSLKAFAALASKLGQLGVFSVVDVGCGQNATLNQLALGLPYDEARIIRPGTLRPSMPDGITSARHTRAFNSLMAEPLPLARSVGIDKYWPADSRSWSRACVYPSELLNVQAINHYDQLTQQHHPNVAFYRGDFANFNMGDFLQNHPGPYEIVHFSFSLYQADNIERQEMIARAQQITQRYIVVLDSLRIDSQDPTKLIFRNNWLDDDFPMRTVFMDVTENQPVWREVFRWRSGRCRELLLNVGRVARDASNAPQLPLWRPLHTLARQTYLILVVCTSVLLHSTLQ